MKKPALTLVKSSPAPRAKRARGRRAAPLPMPAAGLQTFTRLPDDSEDPNAIAAHVPEWKLGAEVIGLVRREPPAGDPLRGLVAIEAFLLALEHGYYPPKWVCEFLGERFQAWHDALGRKSLDELLGLRRGKRRPGAMKLALMRERNEMVLLDVIRFVELGVPVKVAAELAADRLAAQPWDKTGLKLGNIGARHIEKLYNEAGWLHETHAENPTWATGRLSDAQLVAWLRHFPLEQLPIALRRKVERMK